jgi:hypothetical protein
VAKSVLQDTAFGKQQKLKHKISQEITFFSRHQQMQKRKSNENQSSIPKSEHLKRLNQEQKFFRLQHQQQQQQQQQHQQQQHLSLLTAAPPAGIVWTSPSTVNATGAPTALIFSQQFQSGNHVLAQAPAPCYVTLPLPECSNHELFPIMMAREANPTNNVQANKEVKNIKRQNFIFNFNSIGLSNSTQTEYNLYRTRFKM